jgi:hypothetical protein
MCLVVLGRNIDEISREEQQKNQQPADAEQFIQGTFFSRHLFWYRRLGYPGHADRFARSQLS